MKQKRRGASKSVPGFETGQTLAGARRAYLYGEEGVETQEAHGWNSLRRRDSQEPGKFFDVACVVLY